MDVLSARGGVIDLPRPEWVHKEKSWRNGLVIPRYSPPGKRGVRILLSEVDAEAVDSRRRWVRSSRGDRPVRVAVGRPGGELISAKKPKRRTGPGSTP